MEEMVKNFIFFIILLMASFATYADCSYHYYEKAKGNLFALEERNSYAFLSSIEGVDLDFSLFYNEKHENIDTGMERYQKASEDFYVEIQVKSQIPPSFDQIDQAVATLNTKNTFCPYDEEQKKIKLLSRKEMRDLIIAQIYTN
jgi:hypothetical protein